MQFSHFAERTPTSPILAIASAINARQQQGETIHNLTIGDFDPQIFPIPRPLSEAIIRAYRAHQTNYPPAAGLPQLRTAAADMVNRMCGIDYRPEEVLIAAGCRPLIYALYRSVLDAGDKVIYPVPSWNNENYVAMLDAQAVLIETTPQNHFLPTAAEIAPHIKHATLLALCAPQNPTGTIFTAENLREICQLIVAENQRRQSTKSTKPQKPLYVLFDQVYWTLTFTQHKNKSKNENNTDTKFHHPLSLCPDLRPYAIIVDGISKSFASTGVRVGWATAPPALLQKMTALLTHVGAWAPKPEQAAVAEFLADQTAVADHLHAFRAQLQSRLQAFHQGITDLKRAGFPIDAIAPQASIYLSLNLPIRPRLPKPDKTQPDFPPPLTPGNGGTVYQYLLHQANLAILPFALFGAKNHPDWFRLSVGTCTPQQIPEILAKLKSALQNLPT